MIMNPNDAVDRELNNFCVELEKQWHEDDPDDQLFVLSIAHDKHPTSILMTKDKLKSIIDLLTKGLDMENDNAGS